MHGYNGWHMSGIWFWWLPVIVAIGAAIWLAVYYLRRSDHNPGESPEQTLKRRLANGEINNEQFERMLLDLRK